jgi:hypothetical protein
MRPLRSALSLIWVLVMLMLPVGTSAAQDKPSTATTITTKTETQGVVTLRDLSWQAVLDKLFGTPGDGLLDGKKSFEFRAQDLKLTADQWSSFFNPTLASSRDLKALLDAATALHGQVRMDGTINGKPFELRLAGRELKLEGITLTAAQRESLLAQLRGIPGLREMKIEGLVDGKETRIVVAGGKERTSQVRGDRPANGRTEDKQKLDGPQKVNLEHRGDTVQKVNLEHKADTVPKVNLEHRVEVNRDVRPDTRIERDRPAARTVEKPEPPRVGR